jgi:hypothetical protein
MLETVPKAIGYTNWDSFLGGLNTKAAADQLDSKLSPDCQNVYFGMAGECWSRKGYSKWDANSLATNIVRIFDYQYSSSQQLIVHAGTTLYKWGNPNWTSIQTGLTTTAVSLAPFHNFLYITDGALYKRYDGTNMRAWGIAAPGSAPTLAAYTTGTKMSGVYKYKVTYVRGGTYGAESNASSASAALAVTTDGISLSAISTSSDAQVTARNIYRTSANGEAYYYLTQIADNTTTTYNDDTADTSLDTTRVAPTTYTPPSAGKYATVYKNRMWLAVPTTRTVYFSALDQPEYFPSANAITISTNDADQITGMSVLNDALFVFTEDSVWMIQGGYTSSSFSRAKVSGSSIAAAGAIAPESIVNIGTVIFYLSDDGVNVFNGSTVELISESISPSIKAISYTNRQSAVGGWNPTLRQYWVSFPGVGSLTYVFDSVYQYWTKYTHNMRASGVYELTTGDAAQLIGDATYVWQTESGYTDDGSNITWYWKSPVYDGGGSEWLKCLRRGYLTAVATATDSVILNVYKDGSASADQTVTYSVGTVTQTLRANLHSNFRWVQYKVGATNSQQVCFKEWSFYSYARRRM